MNEKQKEKNTSAPILSGSNDQDEIINNRWKIKSWHIASVICLPVFVLSLSLMFLGAISSLTGHGTERSEMPGLGVFLGIMFLVPAFIALIPVYLLRSEKWKKKGAIVCLILGIFGVTLGIIFNNMNTGIGGLIPGVFLLFFTLPAIPLIIAGIYYFWKKV